MAAPRGFAPAEVGGLTAAWPFTDPAFQAIGTRPTDGRAEATVKALADEIAYSARFLPRAPAPLIAAEAADRPAPDTTLWPEPIAADTFARPAPRTDASLWSIEARPTRALHEANVRALTDLEALVKRTDPNDVALLWPNADIVVHNAARGVAGAIETRLRQRNERTQCPDPTWCAVMDAVEKKAAADATTAPIEEAVANFFFEAARGGGYAPSTQLQQADRRERGLGRAALGLRTAPVAPQRALPLPWEMRVLLGGIIAGMRDLEHPTPLWPLRINPAAADGIRTARGGLAGFDLEGVAITRYGVAATGASGVFELAAALAFVDATARRAFYSVVAQFSFEGEAIVLTRADIAAAAPDKPAVHVAFVHASAWSRVERGATSLPALLRSVAEVADRTGGGVPAEYYVLTFVLDRTSPDARVALRTSETSTGIAGYSGLPLALDYDGWGVVAERATFALGAAPGFFFKTVYQPSAGAAPVLLRATSTTPNAAAPAAIAPAATRTPPAAAFPNRVRP